MARGKRKKPYRLIALGRLSAATRDTFGDTLGSFSGLALEPGSWRAKGGGFSGAFVALPDRGFNVPEKNLFSDYPARVHRIGFELKGATLSLTVLGTRRLQDQNGALTTALDPGRGSVKQFGLRLPSPKKGRAAGRISLDSEGIVVCADGSFFISDEFGPNIYRCNANGRITDVVAPPAAFVPYVGGEVCFSSADGIAPKRGRDANNGIEGLSLSPGGKKLYALLQTALVQDRDGGHASERYTRLLVYDASKGVPRKPVGHYVVELPVFGAGDGKRAAEANDIVALGERRILVLSRESYGFGAKEANVGKPIVFKRVMIGTLDGAEDISGSAYERTAKPVARNGKLSSKIAPVKLESFINIADEAELNRVGLTSQEKRVSAHRKLLSAKWESLVLSPPLDAARPRERLLFVGNDNDFRARQIFMPDATHESPFAHDNMILVYRITLPA